MRHVWARSHLCSLQEKGILILTRVQLSIKHHAQTLRKKKGHPFDALSEPVLALIINEYVDKSMRKEGMSRYAAYSSVSGLINFGITLM